MLKLVWMVLAALMLSTPVEALTVTLGGTVPGLGPIGGGQLEVLATQAGLGADSSQIALSTLPVVGTDGASIGASSVAASHSLDVASFSIAYDLATPGLTDAAAVASGTIVFQVDQAASYEVLGGLSVTSAEAEEVLLQASLIDLTDLFSSGTVSLFNSSQRSQTTLGEVLVIGGLGGDVSNTLEGSSTGVLAPGRVYQFSFLGRQLAQNVPNVAPGAATGSAQLILVPEPGVAVLLVGSLVMFALRWTA